MLIPADGTNVLILLSHRLYLNLREFSSVVLRRSIEFNLKLNL